MDRSRPLGHLSLQQDHSRAPANVCKLCVLGEEVLANVWNSKVLKALSSWEMQRSLSLKTAVLTRDRPRSTEEAV